MASDSHPLTWEHSAEPKQPVVDDRLPSEVVTCLENARFLHLATCTHNIPHVSLMNYTYLPSHPFPASAALPAGPTIIMTTNPDSKKTANLVTNPNVSLLVHEWVSSRPSNSSGSGTTAAATRERSPAAAPRSSLAAMLMQMNSTAVSSISATINGEATVLPSGSEEERWCKAQHLANNTFGDDGDAAAATAGAGFAVGPIAANSTGDGGRESYIQGQDVRVVVVAIRDGRISDWKGRVKDFVLASPAGVRSAALVNGDR